MSEQKSEWVKKLEAKIEQADAHLDLLKAKAKEADADTRAAIDRQLDEMKEKRDHAAKRLHEVREDSSEAWDELSDGAKSAWHSLTAAVDRAKDHLG